MDTATLNIVIKVAKEQAEAALKGLGNQLSNTESTFAKVGQKAGDVGKKMTIGLTLPIIGAGVAATNAAVSLGESINAVNVTFGESGKKILAWGETAATAAGLSKSAVNQAAVPIGALLQNMGFSADAAADSTIKLAQRSADIASVFNVDLSDALLAVQSGLRGETEPLRKFGVGLSDVEINAYALRTGLIKVKGTMTEQQKVQARLGLLMEQSSKFAGDFANTSEGLANKQRIMKAQLENSAAALGEKLIPIGQKLVDMVTKWIDKFNKLSPKQQEWIIKIALAAAVLGPLLVAIGALIGAVTAVAGVIAAMSAVVAIVIAVIIVLAAVAFLVIRNWDTVKGWFATFWGWIVGLWQNISAVFMSVWTAISNFFMAIWNGIKAFFTPIVEFFVAYLNIWLAVFSYVFAVMRGIAIVVWNFLWNTLIKPIIDAIVAYFRFWLSVYSAIFNTMMAVAKSIWNAIVGVFNWAMGYVRAIWAPIAGWFSGIWNSITGGARSMGSAIGSAFSGAMSTAKSVVLGAANWIIDKLNWLIRAANNTAGKLPGVPKLNEIPRLAKGTENFRGGLAMVGERGREIVALPGGSRVIPNGQTERIIAGQGDRTVSIGTIILGDQSAVREFFKQLDDDTILSNKGFTPVRGGA